MPTFDTNLFGILGAGCLGALIGMSRQWANKSPGQNVDAVAGVRTFGLWSVLGYLIAFIDKTQVPHLYLCGLVCFVAILLFGHHREAQTGKSFGLTGITAGFITFLLGSMLFWHLLWFTLLCAVLLVLTIALKNSIHEATAKFTPMDIHATLGFAAITGVILPLVPNTGLGPLGAFNPFKIWLMVVFISGTNFIGYVLMRFFGSKNGSLLTGIISGLVSSTACTMALARHSKTEPYHSREFALAILVACTVMLIRMPFLLYILSPSLISPLLIPFLIMSLPGVAMIVWLLYKKGEGEETVSPPLENPLHFKSTLKFGLIYAIVTLCITVVQQTHIGHTGLYAISFISGLIDVNAPMLSLGNMVRELAIGLTPAAIGIIFATLANTIFKMGFVWWAGTPEIRRFVGWGLGGTFVFGAGVLVLQYFLN